MQASNPRAKIVLFSGILMLLIVGIMELCAFVLWRFVLEGDRSVTLYEQARDTSRNFIFDPNLKSAMGKPGTRLVTFSTEFRNSFLMQRIPPFAGGFYGDGIQPSRPMKILVIGDSMVQGIGSVETPRFGWVAQAQRKLPGVDMINLGGIAAAADTQRQVYEVVAPAIPHELVLATFSTGDDYENVSTGGDRSDFTRQVPANLPTGTDIPRFLENSYLAAVYNNGCETLLKWPVPYTWRLISKFTSSLLQGLYLAAHRALPVCRAHGAAIQYGMPADTRAAGVQLRKITDEMIRVRHAEHPGKFVNEDDLQERILNYGGLRFKFRTPMMNQALGAKMARLAAEAVNELFETVRRAGKPFVLVILPTKEEVYLPLVLSGKIEFPNAGVSGLLHLAKQWLNISSGSDYFDDSKLTSVDVDRARKQFIAGLDPQITVIDLTDALRKDAIEFPANLYWKIDGHFSPAGYLAVSRHVCLLLRERVAARLGKLPAACANADSDVKAVVGLGPTQFPRKGKE